ncbi:hypothetical protein [Desulforamulus profundi]|uniref:hypothetical protein n=1 Tax=Desulforamulus profundi TaxID=1383067 RepID=UPI001EE53736|nr:hypothetical protein [Desulforamulus profundi]
MSMTILKYLVNSRHPKESECYIRTTMYFLERVCLKLLGVLSKTRYARMLRDFMNHA